MNLDKILSEANEYAKIRDAATNDPWFVEFVSDGDAGSEYYICFRSGDFVATTDVKEYATFIAAAKNYDSPSVIRILVERVKELTKALRRGDCYCEVGIGNPMMIVHSDICKKIKGEQK